MEGGVSPLASMEFGGPSDRAEWLCYCQYWGLKRNTKSQFKLKIYFHLTFCAWIYPIWNVEAHIDWLIEGLLIINHQITNYQTVIKLCTKSHSEWLRSRNHQSNCNVSTHLSTPWNTVDAPYRNSQKSSYWFNLSVLQLCSLFCDPQNFHANWTAMVNRTLYLASLTFTRNWKWY